MTMTVQYILDKMGIRKNGILDRFLTHGPKWDSRKLTTFLLFLLGKRIPVTNLSEMGIRENGNLGHDFLTHGH